MSRGPEDKDLENLRDQILLSMRSERSHDEHHEFRERSRLKHERHSRRKEEIFDTDMDDLDSLRNAVLKSIKGKSPKPHQVSSSHGREGRSPMRLPEAMPKIHFRSSHPTSPQFPSPPCRIQPKLPTKNETEKGYGEKHRRRDHNVPTRRHEASGRRDRGERTRHDQKGNERRNRPCPPRTQEPSKRTDKWSRLENEPESSDGESSEEDVNAVEPERNGEDGLERGDATPISGNGAQDNERRTEARESGGERSGGVRRKKSRSQRKAHEPVGKMEEDLAEDQRKKKKEEEREEEAMQFDEDILAMLDREIQESAVEFLDDPDSDASPRPTTQEPAESSTEEAPDDAEPANESPHTSVETPAEKLRSELAAIDKKLGTTSTSSDQKPSSKPRSSGQKKRRSRTPLSYEEVAPPKNGKDHSSSRHKDESRHQTARDQHFSGDVRQHGKPIRQLARTAHREGPFPSSAVGRVPGISRDFSVQGYTVENQRYQPRSGHPNDAHTARESSFVATSVSKQTDRQATFVPPQAPKEDLREMLKQRKPILASNTGFDKNSDFHDHELPTSPRKVVHLRNSPIPDRAAAIRSETNSFPKKRSPILPPNVSREIPKLSADARRRGRGKGLLD